MKTNKILFYVYFSNFGNVFWWRASVFCPHGLSACIYCNYSFILWNKKDVCKQLFLIIFRCSVVILKARKTASCVFNIITSSKPLVLLHSPNYFKDFKSFGFSLPVINFVHGFLVSLKRDTDLNETN